MTKTGVLLEIAKGRAKEINHGLLTAVAKDNENEVIAFALGVDVSADKKDLAQFGASKLVKLETEGEAIGSSPDLAAQALIQAMENYGLDCLAGLATAAGRDIFARIAAKMDKALVSDVLNLDLAGKSAVRSHFSGKTMATVQLEDAPVLVTVRPNAVSPEEKEKEIQVEDFTAKPADPALVSVQEVKQSGQEQMDLTEAPIIITGGRPIGGPDNYKILEECAKALGGAVGASRAAVDAGYAPHSMQVGQTGKTVSPNLYIACGVSGAVQHFAGMKTSKVIVGINTDKDAPIFEKCDYGIVGDMFEVVPALTQALKEQSG